jgi:hypothetical protein
MSAHPPQAAGSPAADVESSDFDLCDESSFADSPDFTGVAVVAAPILRSGAVPSPLAPPAHSTSQYEPPRAAGAVSAFHQQLLALVNERVDPASTLTYGAAVRRSPFNMIASGEQRINAIAAEFNRFIEKPILQNASARAGVRVPPGYFLVAERNRRCELRVGRGLRLALRVVAGYTEAAFVGPPERSGLFKQTESVIGAFGTFLVNVPVGYVAKVTLTEGRVILGPGAHVIHDPNFHGGGEECDALSRYAQRHAALRATTAAAAAAADPPVRPNRLVPAGGEDPLPPWIVRANFDRLDHGTLHLVRVPANHLGRVIVDNVPVILPHRRAPYAFRTAIFDWLPPVLEATAVVQHAPYFLLRVPNGQVARLWRGSTPLLLEAQQDPYVFLDPIIRVDEPTEDEAVAAAVAESTGGQDAVAALFNAPVSMYESAFARVITHGTITRAWPVPTEVVIVRRSERLEVVRGPCTITDPADALVGCLNCGLATVLIPKGDRLVGLTRDALYVRMQLVVAYDIPHPEVLITRLPLRSFRTQVNAMIRTEALRILQQTHSADLVSVAAPAGEDAASAASHTAVGFATRLSAVLSPFFTECGMRLVRLGVAHLDTPFINGTNTLDSQVRAIAAASAEVAILQQRTAVARAHAEMACMAERVQREQELEQFVAAARTAAEVAKVRAERTVAMAVTNQERARKLGQAFREHPELLQRRIAQLAKEALAKARINLIGPDGAVTAASVG